MPVVAGAVHTDVQWPILAVLRSCRRAGPGL